MLLVDIGNTRIKFTDRKQPFKVKHTAHKNLQPIFTQLQQQQSKQILITAGRSSHAQQAQKQIIEHANTRLITVEKVSVTQEKLAVNYDNPKQFGADRFLNLLGAKHHYGNNFCVISCGTAITLDFYTNHHIGGMITLGVTATRELLAEKTQLNQINKPSDLLGNSTATAIGSGIYFGYQNLIYGSIKSIEEKENLSFHKVFTGGDSQLLCKEEAIVIPHLLFEGMQQYLQ